MALTDREKVVSSGSIVTLNVVIILILVIVYYTYKKSRPEIEAIANIATIIGMTMPLTTEMLSIWFNRKDYNM